jgi:hypothetical protein
MLTRCKTQRLQKVRGQMRRPKAEGGHRAQGETRWSLLTPHALVLLCIANAPDTRVREIAELVGISERGAHKIVADLVSARYVHRTRVGRRNRYVIEEKTALRHGPVRHRRVASIVALLGPEPAMVVRPTRASATARGPSRSAVSKSTRKRAA